jgi:hypothetical protein
MTTINDDAATPATQPAASASDWYDALSGKAPAKNSDGLSYSYAAPNAQSTNLFDSYKKMQGLEPTFSVGANVTPGSHGKDGQNVLSGEGHVDFQQNPFVGTSRDNIYARAGAKLTASNKDFINSPQAANDSVLLPTDDDNGSEPVATPKPAEQSRGQERTQPGKLVDKLVKRRVDDSRLPALAPATPAAGYYYRPADTSGSVKGQKQVEDEELFARKDRENYTTPQPKEVAQSLDTVANKMLPGFQVSANAASTPTAGTPIPEQTPPPQATVPAPHTPSTSEAPDNSRKIIRDGEMSFQVDSFDSAFLQITKIAAEEGGFVADTQSEKLSNGKMSGVITVRVPPDHLDTLTLKLRALGDLTGQKISAQDITKEYTDLESELRAAKAMEDRLLEIIKTGSGQVKDLVAAEREVGVWREKVEKVTGEINYYNNLISLSTLRLTLEEKDIRRAALASEKETVEMGIETVDVEKARLDVMHALDEAKARIIQADLKKLDAGQLAATIVADVSPEAAGPVIDHFKQLGRVARLNIDRQQTVAEGATVTPGIKVDRQDTRLQISLYNLANVSPRQTTNLTMACTDVETAYHTIIAKVYDAGGRVVDSALNRVKPDQTDGTITFETPRDKADSVLAAVRALGEVMHLNLTENPDAANVTTAKQGFALTLASEAMIPARETIATTLMPAGQVADAYHAIIDAAKKNRGDITTAQLQEQNSQSDSATLIFDVSRDAQPAIEKSIADAIGSTGRVITRQSSRSNDTEHTLDSKVQFTMTFASAGALQARETIVRVVAVDDVGGFYNQVLAAAQQAGAKVLTAIEDQSNPSNPTGQLNFVIDRTQAGAIEKLVSEVKGGVISRSVSRSADVNSTTDEKADLRFAIGALSQLPPRQTTTMNLEASDPESASATLQAAVLAAGGRVVEQHLLKDDKYQAHLVVQVPLAKGSDFLGEIRDAGSIQTVERTEDQTIPAADFAQAKFDLTLNAASAVVGPQAGLWAGLKSSVSASIRGLAYSFELIIIGICLALPWVVLGWVGWKGAKRLRKKIPSKVSPQAGTS